jgi:hypothetical protein
MIRYSLRCNSGHEFEAWFASSAAYDRAAGAGANACPVCQSKKVEKALMAPAVAGAKKEETGTVSLAAVDPRRLALQQAIREFRSKVTEGADYVGGRFAEEARKIHYREVEPRGIYGEATLEEARQLAEEEIAFQPLPSLPEESN